uniref:Uncharacterized protein n=1 Tax=Ixodes ricinus TaxID=34613 RepID=A0A6B0UGM5_IXORI
MLASPSFTTWAWSCSSSSFRSFCNCFWASATLSAREAGRLASDLRPRRPLAAIASSLLTVEFSVPSASALVAACSSAFSLRRLRSPAECGALANRATPT